MKKLLSFIVVLCSVVVAAAQERVIDKSEFDSIVSNGNMHRVAWKDQKYRMTVTASAKIEGRPATDYASKMIFEYGSSNEFRNISSSSFGEKPNPTMQSLRVGDWMYSKSGDKPWTRKKIEPGTQSEYKETERPTQDITSNVEYKHLGSGTFMNLPVQIYVKNEKRTSVNKTTGAPIETDARSTYWVDAAGILLKSEHTSESRGLTVNHTTVTTVWERDPSIKFVVPEVDQ